MSDLGADVGNHASQISMNVTVKLIEALAKLTGNTIKAFIAHNSTESRMARMKFNELKTDIEKRDFLQSLNFKAGEVNYAKLVKNNVPLVSLGIENGKMSAPQFKEFARICKDEGVIVSGVKATPAGGDAKKPYYILHCRESDLSKIQHCLDIYNDRQMLKAMDAKLSEYANKGFNNLSQAERLERADLLNQKAFLLNNQNRIFNDTQTNSVISNAYNPVAPEHRESFETALNRLKDNDINKDLNFVVADMANPERHIKCHAFMDKYIDKNGEPFERKGRSEYIKTEYAVYNGDALLMETTDGLENVKTVQDWYAIRNNMQQTGNFSGGEMLRFQTEKDYSAFMNQRALTDKAEKGITEIADYRDCSEAIASVENYLDKNGFEAVYTNGENGEPLSVSIVDKHTKEPINALDDNSMQAKINADCVTAGRQLDVYKKIEYQNNEIKIAESEMNVFAEGSPEYVTAKENLALASENIEDLKSAENDLLVEREKFVSSKAEHIRDEADRLERGGDDISDNALNANVAEKAGINLANVDALTKNAKELGASGVDKVAATMPAHTDRG